MLERGGQYSESKLPDITDPKQEAEKRLTSEELRTRQNKNH